MKYQILFPLETICMKYQILLSGKNKKNLINLSAENFTQHAEPLRELIHFLLLKGY